MIVRLCRVAASCLCCFIAGASAGWAQESQLDNPGEIPKYVRDPIPLHTTGLGPFHRPISSKSTEAQAFFDQGFQMQYAFARLDAIRSFREAWKRDPDCAICYWAEGWAWGSYLNGPMSAEQSPFAYAATQKAISMKDKATPKERAFIDALAVRYVKEFDAKTRKLQDQAYADAMAKVAGRYPDDLDAVTLYADALFLLEPRASRRDVNAPSIKRLHGVLESALAQDPKHPGACHLYVHATESTVKPELAVACAEFLGKTIPGASHRNHMPSHTWNEVGRWGDSVRANLDAWHSDLKADATAVLMAGRLRAGPTSSSPARPAVAGTAQHEFEGLVAAFNRRDPQAVMARIAGDVVLTYAGRPDSQHQDVEKGFAQMWANLKFQPNYTTAIEEICESDSLAVIRVIWEVSYKDPQGNTRTNREKDVEVWSRGDKGWLLKRGISFPVAGS